MKKLICLIVLVGCCNQPVDDNHVSVASYRETLQRVQSNLGNIQSSLEKMRDADTGHSDWWSAKIGLVSDTSILCSSTLAGAH